MVILAARGKEVQEVTGLFSRPMPICRGRRQQVRFQFGLPKAQCFFVRLDIRQEPAQFGRFLRGHATMLIELDRLIGHDRALRRASGYFALSYSRRISSLPYLCSSTSRNAPARHSRGSPSIANRMAWAACSKRL